MRTGTVLVPIFYGSSWTAAQKTIILDFLSGLGGSTWMGITSLYSDDNGFYQNTGLFSSTASKAYASLPTGTYGLGTTLSDAQVCAGVLAACML